MNIDPSGEFILSLIKNTIGLVEGIIIIIVGVVFLFYITLLAIPEILKGVQTIMEGVATEISILIDGARALHGHQAAEEVAKAFDNSKTAIQYFTEEITIKIAQRKRLYKDNETNIHHIVARIDPRAARAKKLIQSVGIHVDSPPNLVRLQKDLHVMMHTTKYHAMVTVTIVNAYYNINYISKQTSVLFALQFLRTYLIGLNNQMLAK